MKWLIYISIFIILSIIFYEILATLGFLFITLANFEITNESILLLKFWENAKELPRVVGFRFFVWMSAISGSALILFQVEEDF